MTVCPQCGYERKTNDDSFVSSEECPKCGIIYKKWKPTPDFRSTESILENNVTFRVTKEKKAIQYKSIILSVIVIILMAVFAKFIFFARDKSSRLVSTLPVTLPIGMESNSYLIRASGDEGTTTAAGQLFKPPLKTPVLFKLGFLFTQHSSFRVPNFKLQVILSEWYGDRPAPTALWVSEPTTIPSTNNDFQADWIDFEVPYLLLDPEKLYIAWITLSGLSNEYNASVGIPAMGPTYSNNRVYIGTAYPEGTYTLYRQANPNGDISQMTNSDWEVHDAGHNLSFRMWFDNSKKTMKDSENYASQNRLNDIIRKKTEESVIQRREKEQQKREENKQQQEERQIQQQEKAERRQAEIEQQQAEIERQQVEREQEQEANKRQQIEMEIQQYEREKQQEEINQKQEEMRQQQRDRLYMEPRRVQKIPRRR